MGLGEIRRCVLAVNLYKAYIYGNIMCTTFKFAIIFNSLPYHTILISKTFSFLERETVMMNILEITHAYFIIRNSKYSWHPT